MRARLTSSPSPQLSRRRAATAPVLAWATALALLAAGPAMAQPAQDATPRERALELLAPLFNDGEEAAPTSDAQREQAPPEAAPPQPAAPPPRMTDIPNPMRAGEAPAPDEAGETSGPSPVDATTSAIAVPLAVPEAGPETRGATYRLTVAGREAGRELAVREGVNGDGLWLALAPLVAAGSEDGLTVTAEAGFAGGATRHGSHVHLSAAPARLYRSDAPDSPVAELPDEAVIVHEGSLFVTPGLATEMLRRTVEAERQQQRVRLGRANPPADTAAGYTPPQAPAEPPAIPAGDLQLFAEAPLAASEPSDLPRLVTSATLDGRAGPWELGGQISARNRADTLGSAASPGVNGEASLDRLSLTAGRELPRGAGSAVLLPRRVEGGDVLPVDGPVGSGAAVERGVRADSLPRHRYPDLAEVNLRGGASPGSTVLAFQDGRLVDGTRIGLDGRYSLDPAPLGAGPNDLDVVTIKGSGRHSRTHRHLDTTAARFEPGRPAYQASLTQTNAPLWPTESEAVAPSLDLPGSPTTPKPTAGGVRSAGTAYIPVSERWRTSLSAEFADPDATEPLAAGRIGTTGVLGPALADGGLTFGPDRRLAGEAGLRWGGEGWRLGARQRLADRYRPSGPDSPALAGTAATTRLDAALRQGDEDRVSSVGLSWQRRQADDAVTHRGEVNMGGVAQGQHLATGLGAELGNDAAPADWAVDGHIAAFLPLDPVTTVALLESRKAATRDLTLSSYGAAHYSVTQRFTTSVLGRYDQQAAVRGEAGLRFSWRLGGMEAGIQGSRTSQQTTRLGLSVRARLGAPPTPARQRVASQPDLDRGAIDARVAYADRVNPTGQPAGSPVAGARVEVDGLNNSGRTDQHGAALVEALPPEEEIAVGVDEDSLQLPDRRRARPQRATRRTRIGRAPVARFTIEDDGRLTGTLNLRTADATVPAPGLPITLRSAEAGDVVAIAHTGGDGTFRFSGVAAGSYSLGVGRQAARGLGYRAGLRQPADLARPGSQQQGVALMMAKASEQPRPTGTRGADGVAPAPHQVPPSLGDTSATASGPPFVLYLGDYSTASDRTLAWFGLQQRFAEVLGETSQLTPDRARATVPPESLPAETSAPLYAGPIDSAERAREICAELGNSQQFCEVRPRPEGG